MKCIDKGCCRRRDMNWTSKIIFVFDVLPVKQKRVKRGERNEADENEKRGGEKREVALK